MRKLFSFFFLILTIWSANSRETLGHKVFDKGNFSNENKKTSLGFQKLNQPQVFSNNSKNHGIGWFEQVESEIEFEVKIKLLPKKQFYKYFEEYEVKYCLHSTKTNIQYLENLYKNQIPENLQVLFQVFRI